jgi:hypothetical protein
MVEMGWTEAECFILTCRRVKTLKTNLRSKLHFAMLLFFDQARRVLDDPRPGKPANMGGDLQLGQMTPNLA